MISVGAWINFGTEANHFSNVFPGIDIHLMTLNTNFFFPFIRELFLLLGICSVSRRSCDNILTAGPGKALMIVPGGANESVFARPGINDLVIKKRLGFIKLALRTGASLVPVFSFGENELWDQLPNPKGSKLREFQDLARKYTTVNPPALYGRGVFTYNFGILPYRHHIVSVVGKPIDCPKIENPTIEEIKFYQAKYLEEVQQIYDNYKDEYLPVRISELQFVE